MNGRNKLTMVIVALIISGSAIAITITVRDYNTIINDLQEFVNDPFSWNVLPDEGEGILKFYITGDIATEENETVPLDLIIEDNPTSYTVYYMYLIINKIELKAQGENVIIELFEDPIIIELFDVNNTVDLLSVTALPARKYSALQFYYDKEIVAFTSQGNKTFNTQGFDFFTIPFYQSRSNNTQTPLAINKNEETSLLLELQMRIRWTQQIIFPHFYGYLNF